MKKIGNEKLAYSGHTSEKTEKDNVGSQVPQRTVVLEEEEEEEENKKEEEEEYGGGEEEEY